MMGLDDEGPKMGVHGTKVSPREDNVPAPNAGSLVPATCNGLEEAMAQEDQNVSNEETTP